MATTGFVLPTANNNDDGIENNWNNPANAQTDNTSATNPNGQDAVWFWSGFDFAGSGDGLASGDTVTAINVRIRGYDSYGDGGWSLQIAHKSDASNVWSTYTGQRMPATGSFQTSQTPLTRTLALTDVPTATEALSSNFRLGVQVSPGSADPTEATLELIEVEIVFTAAGGGGAITGSTSVDLSGSGSVTGTGALAGSESVQISGAAALTSTGVLTATAQLSFSASGAVSGLAGIASSATIGISEAATLSGTASINASSLMQLTTSPTLSGIGSGALQASTTINLTPAGGITATGSLSATSAVTFGSSASLVGNASILGSTTLAFSESASLTAVAAGSIAGATTLNLSGSATLTGTGLLANSTGITFSASATPLVVVDGGGISKRKKKIIGLPTAEDVAKRAKQRRDEQQVEKEREALEQITSSTKLKEKLREFKAKGLTKGLTEDRIESIAKIDDDIHRALAIEFALDKPLDFERREKEALAILLMVS